MAYSALISAWLVGALGGLHCLAMCGGFIAATAARVIRFWQMGPLSSRKADDALPILQAGG